MAGLSTHVLDTSKGKPAVELKIELYKILDIEKILIKTVLTNEDGRIDEPLLSAVSLEESHYELLFFAGDYLKKQNSDLKHVFLDKIPIRFFVNNKGTLNDSSGEQASSSVVAGTEAMRLDSSGRLLIGTTSTTPGFGCPSGPISDCLVTFGKNIPNQ